MASPRSDSDRCRIVACLQESARRGDWTQAESLAAVVQEQAAPENRKDAEEYLEYLKSALMVAKASRADTAATLARLRAASGFSASGNELPPRAKILAT